MKECYIRQIAELLEKCEDIALLDLILRLLKRKASGINV